MAVQAQVLLSYVMPDGTAGSIWVDASVSEQHGVQAQVTEHQVESGENLADYIRPMPQKVSLQAHVTNTPITASRGPIPSGASANVIGELSGGDIQTQGRSSTTSFKALTFDNIQNRPQAVYDAFANATLSGAIWSVYTSLVTYTNMALTNVSAPRDAESGNAILFSLDFQQIRIVDSQTVEALKGLVIPKQIQKVSKGKQSTREADQNTADKSRSMIQALRKANGG